MAKQRLSNNKVLIKLGKAGYPEKHFNYENTGRTLIPVDIYTKHVAKFTPKYKLETRVRLAPFCHYGYYYNHHASMDNNYSHLGIGTGKNYLKELTIEGVNSNCKLQVGTNYFTNLLSSIDRVN